MCGIAGQLLRERKAELADIRLMCDQIRHRGPDDEGYHLDNACGLGMRRLSIIDLNTGHQPISNEDGTIWVVFNGEIYNFRELRADLIAAGHRFKTNSDTETLVHLYEEEGTAGIANLRGMFAYAIWDSNDRSLLLVRDRFGKKPLYYAILPEGLYFGSELKCMRVAGVPLDLDREALQLYFQFNYIPDPWSPYKAVRKLAPGGWLRCHANGKTEEGSYWKLPAPVEQAGAGLTETGARDSLRKAFDEAVHVRLISDVPLGAFLSGGIDSSSVVASMALQTREPVKTFSIGFEEPEFNELPLAALVARKYKTDHHEIIVRPNSVDLVSKLVRHFDEPFADSSAIPTYLVSEFAAAHVKVVLTGDGGDELFAGYQSFFDIQRLRPLDRYSFCSAENAVDNRGRATVFRLRQKLFANDQPANRPGAIFRARITALPAEEFADAGVDAARRRCLPSTETRSLLASQWRRCPYSGPLFRSHRQTHRRHTGKGGSDVHGEFARSPLPNAG